MPSVCLSPARLLSANVSDGSPGCGGVPMNTISGFGLTFVAGIMSFKALTVRICASSKISTSTASKPRPKPCSRAPNMIRLPLRNAISCWPFARRICSTCPAINLFCAKPHIDWNVSSEVLVRCAVHSTLRLGCMAHRMNTAEPMVNVLPTWRHIDMTVPPSPHAYRPFSRLPSMRYSSPCCHRS